MKRRCVVPLAGLLFVSFVIASGATGCSHDWPTFRHDGLRWGNQPHATALSDPTKVTSLKQRWLFQPAGAQGFTGASPIVYNGIVYIGNQNGYFYAVNEETGVLVWQYPDPQSKPLVQRRLVECGTCCVNASAYGITSTAAIATIQSTDAVIFGAPDTCPNPAQRQPSLCTGNGDGHLFALNAATGTLMWRSPVVARLTGLVGGRRPPFEFHEQIGYSSPLVTNHHVYVGIADHCDNPIQKGQVVAVHLDTGQIDNGFRFSGAGNLYDPFTVGGGVWSSIAGGTSDIYVTTGNGAGAPPEPDPDHVLSMLRLDENTGRVVWQVQPIAFESDRDTDWAVTPSVMLSSCGTLAVSTQKNGWTHAVNADTGRVRWVFPYPFPRTGADPSVYDQNGYVVHSGAGAGAVWEDVYIAQTVGFANPYDDSAHNRLHALNACARTPEDRIRWMHDLPGKPGPPTVSRGVVFVGTDTGQLVVIADPSIGGSTPGFRCNDPYATTAQCAALHRWFPQLFWLVRDPVPLLPPIQLQGAIHTEPALAHGRVFVATDAGNLYMLAPDP